MLVKLGSYLRCLGCDAIYDRDLPAAEIASVARREGRIFLTRNRHLHHHLRLPEHALLIGADDPVEQLHEVMAATGLGPERLFTRCVRCNVELEPLEREAARGRVPEVVLERYRAFHVCPSCGTLFWKGQHVRNTCRKLRLPDVSEDRPGPD